MNITRSCVVRIIPVMIIMGIIFSLSHQSGDDLSLPGFLFAGADKVAHVVMYTALAWGVIYAFSEQFKSKYPFGVMVFTVLFCLAHGLLDEFHQFFVPGRFTSVSDVIADCAGALLCCAVWAWHRKISFLDRLQEVVRALSRPPS